MFKILVYIIFILSVALAAGSIVLTTRLRAKYKSEIFTTLLYSQVFIYTFGFYGIWGQVIIRAFLSSYISAELLERFSNVLMLLGLPFLVFAWLMLIRFSSGISGRETGKWFVFWFLFVNILILVTLGYIITKTDKSNPALLIKYYFIVMNLINVFISAYLVHIPWKGRSVIHDYDRRIIAPLLFLIMVVQCSLLFFYNSQEWLAVLFIFAFFAGNTFLPLYFSYGTLLSVFTVESANEISFADFCREYDVSPRESEIVREICNGLSNKEISDKLFISLQTVKDHTHRIYIKTNVRSRVQLINLIKELELL